MVSPLAGSLARQIGRAASSIFLPATLVRDVPGVIVDAADPPAPTQATYPCKAIVEVYSERYRLDGLVKQNERKVIILATTLSVRPAVGDRVTISGITFTLAEVSTDPAEAAWECKGQM